MEKSSLRNLEVMSLERIRKI